MTSMTLLLALFVQEARPFRAKVILEETLRSGDAVTRTQGTVLVRPGESVSVQWPDSRRVYRGDGLHPFDVWALDPSALREKFEVLNVESAGERALPERAEGIPVVKAKRSARSLASAGGTERTEEGLRLVPRDASLKHLVIRAWRVEGRLERVEIETPTRRTVCALEAIRDLETEER